MLVILEEIDSIHLKGFKYLGGIIERVQLIEIRSTVADGTRKQSHIDASFSSIEFHSSTMNPFINALMKGIKPASSLSELPVLTAFPKGDPAVFPETYLSDFLEQGTQELHAFYNFYGNEATDEYHGRLTRFEKLLCCPYDALELEFVKVTSTPKRVKFERNFFKRAFPLKQIFIKESK